jgi:hypothetical protein
LICINESPSRSPQNEDDDGGPAGTLEALRVAIAAALDDPEGRQLGRQASRSI